MTSFLSLEPIRTKSYTNWYIIPIDPTKNDKLRKSIKEFYKIFKKENS